MYEQNWLSLPTHGDSIPMPMAKETLSTPSRVMPQPHFYAWNYWLKSKYSFLNQLICTSCILIQEFVPFQYSAPSNVNEKKQQISRILYFHFPWKRAFVLFVLFVPYLVQIFPAQIDRQSYRCLSWVWVNTLWVFK